MKLDSLVNVLALKSASVPQVEVTGVTGDSRRVRPGFLFVAVRGSRQDGHVFIEDALARGAAGIVTDERGSRWAQGRTGALIIVEDAREALGMLAAQFYAHPSASLKVIGITGTNGKTTVSYLLEALLSGAGKKCGVIGTVNYRYGGVEEPAPHTTPAPEDLQALLSRMRQARMEYVAMEVSSHALQQRRAAGVRFSAALFTNLTQDHLDYHGSFEEYFCAKSLLFTTCSVQGPSVINTDDAYGRRLLCLSRIPVVTYAIDAQADYSASAIGYCVSGTTFSLCGPQGQIRIESGLIGRHNVYNALAASALAAEEGFEYGLIRDTLKGFPGVPGRLERIGTDRGFSVFVDYAHTDDALANVLRSLREVSPDGRILVVFGCGGDRDRSKRPLMGAVVARQASYQVVTSEKTRTENTAAIMSEITAGMGGGEFCVIPDRREAIRFILARARPGDIVLVAGKGHETYQLVGPDRFDFDDRAVVRALLTGA